MSSLLQPFTGYIPAPEFAHRVVGPPVSTLSPDQREEARADPLSFRHVAGKGAGTTVKEAREWLRTCNQNGVLKQVGPAVFIYRLTKGSNAVTGVIAEVSITAYDSGLIKRHETTISRTERKMAKYMHTTRVYGNPVALAHRPSPSISATILAGSSRHADYSFTTTEGSTHELWVIEGSSAIELCSEFPGEVYITDGHHRLAAASNIASRERRMNPYLPAGLFSSDELYVKSFARCIVDPTIDIGATIDRLRNDHELEAVDDDDIRPGSRHELGVKIGTETFRLRIRASVIPDDVYHSLDVKLLQDLILEPVFGISNPRNDGRLHFLADQTADGISEITCDAYFLPFPASVGDVMAVADSGRAMPPKSTLFTPKLPSGLVIRQLDDY